MNRRDIFVLGGSEGALEGLKAIAKGLPEDLPAALFVVVHSSAGFESHLAEILSRSGPLRATHAVHGEPIVPGHIYVAPPDNHLLVRPGHVAVQRGPKENGFRPAVDPLFRSAAVAYGSRIAAVVLSGHFDCGTAGLLSVKARGGLAIAQDLGEAKVQGMPKSAMNHLAIDHVLTAAEIGRLLAKLAREPAPDVASAAPAAGLLELEGDEPGSRSDVVCPVCQGALTEAQFAGMASFRCHVGHAFSPAALLAEQAESLERALWAAVRALDESSLMATRMATAATKELRARFIEKARTQSYQAEIVRRMLLGGGSLTVGEAFAVANEDRDR